MGPKILHFQEAGPQTTQNNEDLRIGDYETDVSLLLPPGPTSVCGEDVSGIVA